MTRISFLSTIWVLGCVSILLLACGQPSSAATVTLPLERSAYFTGEDIPLTVTPVNTPVRVLLRDAAGKVVLASPPSMQTNWRLPTAQLAPGAYTLQVEGDTSSTPLTLTSPLRESCAALVEEGTPDARTPAQRDNLARVLRESGLNAFMAPGITDPGRLVGLDTCAQTGAMAFLNLQSRPMSFNPPRVYAPELAAFRQRLALNAQANGRYPTFGGIYYDWDPCGPFSRNMLLTYWGWGTRTQELRNYNTRSNQAVYDEFTRRTGLQPVTTTEYLQYCLAIGQPEMAPAIDLPTYHWLEELAPTFPKLSDAARQEMETRLDAWSAYLMGLYAETYAGNNAVLREVMPSLRHTSSINADHAAVREGQWQPSANAVLDFNFMTAWNDQVTMPDYTFQWLFSAGLLDCGKREGSPTWIASSFCSVFGQAPYPGKFLRMAGHNLAYGGRGLGFALEGFSNLIGGMDSSNTNWQVIKGNAGESDVVTGRDFLRRFAPLSAACAEVRTVGVLYSQTQLGRQHLTVGIDTPPYNAFITLARLGYMPRFVTEEQILTGNLREFAALVVVNQSAPLPTPVMARIGAYIAAGGRVVRDAASTVDFPGATRCAVNMSYAAAGKPHCWSVPSVTDTPSALMYEQRYAQIAPLLLAALGNSLRSPLIAANAPAAKVSTFTLDGGPDARYVVAVNDAIVQTSYQWVRGTETLQPNGVTSGTLYDLTTEQALGAVAPVACQFENLTVHLYGLLARPVAAIDVRAKQTITAGEPLPIGVCFLDAKKAPLCAAIPFTLTITQPDGTVVQTLYRATDRAGAFACTWPLPSNAAPGTWTLSIHSSLDGTTTTLPVTVKAGRPQGLVAIEEPVMVRGTALINTLLATHPDFVLPLFSTQDALRPAAEAVQAALARRGCAVEIREKPEMTTYVMGYDPDQAALAENARAEHGEAIGAIKCNTVSRNDYFTLLSGYVFGKPIVLLDLVGQPPVDKQPVSDNPLAEKLADSGLLWPKADATFPGPGKATVQIVKSAFGLGVDAIVIQASDPAGLLAGARALGKLPADWITPGIDGARQALLTGFTIDPAPATAISTKRLTARGAATHHTPNPLALAFPNGMPVSAEEYTPFVPKVPTPVTLPAVLKPRQLLAYYRIKGEYQRCGVVGDSAGDTRFQDAVAIPVDAGAGGKVTITIDGTFRYADRLPWSQSQWEELLALRNKERRPRGPVMFEALIDGKPAGTLIAVAVADQTVPIISNPPQSVKEEVVTQVGGTVSLPAGSHQVMLIHHNIVDGLITQVTLTR